MISESRLSTIIKEKKTISLFYQWLDLTKKIYWASPQLKIESALLCPELKLGCKRIYYIKKTSFLFVFRYVLGNFDCLCKGKKTDLWMKIVNIAKAKNSFGNMLNLSCQNHLKNNFVSNEKDFEKIAEGGCLEICNMKKPCGHTW